MKRPQYEKDRHRSVVRPLRAKSFWDPPLTSSARVDISLHCTRNRNFSTLAEMFSVLFVTRRRHTQRAKKTNARFLSTSLSFFSSLHSFLSQGATCSNLPTSPSPRRIIFTPRRRTRWLNLSSAWNRALSEKGRCVWWPFLFRGTSPQTFLSRPFKTSFNTVFGLCLHSVCTTWLSHYHVLLVLVLKILNQILILILLILYSLLLSPSVTPPCPPSCILYLYALPISCPNFTPLALSFSSSIN